MKRILGLLLALVMLMSMIPAAYAKDVTEITIKLRLDNNGYMEAMAEEFNKTHEDIHVTILPRADTTDQERNAMLTQLSAGSSEVDVMLVDTAWLQEFAAAGWLEPLDSYLPEGFNDDFFPMAKNLVSYNGGQYAILRQTDLSALFYRTDLFEEKGLTPPSTWDELLEAGKALTDDDTWGFVWQGKQYEGLVCDWIEILHSLGGGIFDNYDANPGERKITLNSPEAIQATNYLNDFVNISKISPEGVLSYTEEPSRDVFVAGQAAMLRLWQSTPSHLINPATSNVVDKWGVVPIPAGPNGSRTCIGGWASAINVFSEHKEEAWEVLNWFTSTEFMAGQFVNTGNAPSRISSYEHEIITSDPLWSSIASTYQEIGKTGMPRPLSVVWSKESDVIQRALHSVFAGQKDAATAMADAAAEIKVIEDGFKASQK